MDKFLYPDEGSPVPDRGAKVWGVIQKDNLARENVADTWVLVPFYLSEDQACRVRDILRENCSDHSDVWYAVAHKGQRLNRGMYDLV
jgi:hypothetical protein